MKFYEIAKDHHDPLTEVHYRGTLSDAQTVARAFADHVPVRVTEVEVGSDKEAVLQLLNLALGVTTTSSEESTEPAVIKSRGRQWAVTKRGGLKEVEEGSGPVIL